MKNIALIGMPGAGKSTVGVVLAKALTMDFCDTDLVLQAKAGCRLQSYIEQNGNKAFLSFENKTVAELSLENTVIATGGSVVYGEDAMRRLHETAVVVYLQIGYDEMARRVADYRARGIAMGECGSLREMYDERIPLYEREADIVVDAEHGSVEQTVAFISTRLLIRPGPVQ